MIGGKSLLKDLIHHVFQAVPTDIISYSDIVTREENNILFTGNMSSLMLVILSK